MNRSTDTSLSSPALAHRLRPQPLLVAIALFVLSTGAIALGVYGWKHSTLFLIGGLLGATLYHSSFGFASAYRKLFVSRQVQGMYAQLVMLAIATLLFAPVLASGSAFGQAVKGAVAPVGVQGAIGAFLFGIGMQLGGACGCGTLYTIGGGSLSMLVTLFTFCLGAFAASLTRQLWAGLPSMPPIVLGQAVGWEWAIVLQFILFGLLAVLLSWWSRTKSLESSAVDAPLEDSTQHSVLLNVHVNDPDPRPIFSFLRERARAVAAKGFSANTILRFSHVKTFIYGPWSLLTGAIALAVLNWFTLLLSGHPWRITWGFALWAAQVATWLGWDPASSPFWGGGAGQKALSEGIFADVSATMNFGIVLGAVLAAALAGRLSPKIPLFSWRSLCAAVWGGLVMGYGAFLAFGCNVSAFFGGIASTSLHGWVWIACALAGTAIGIRLRPWARLPNK